MTILDRLSFARQHQTKGFAIKIAAPIAPPIIIIFWSHDLLRLPTYSRFPLLMITDISIILLNKIYFSRPSHVLCHLSNIVCIHSPDITIHFQPPMHIYLTRVHCNFSSSALLSIIPIAPAKSTCQASELCACAVTYLSASSFLTQRQCKCIF